MNSQLRLIYAASLKRRGRRLITGITDMARSVWSSMFTARALAPLLNMLAIDQRLARFGDFMAPGIFSPYARKVVNIPRTT
jgi:hypothetical protein